MVFPYPLFNGVGLAYGPFCSWNTVGDTPVALAKTPQLIANFLDDKQNNSWWIVGAGKERVPRRVMGWDTETE